MKTNTLQDKLDQLQRLYDAECDKSARLREALAGIMAEIDDCSQTDLWDNYDKAKSALANDQAHGARAEK